MREHINEYTYDDKDMPDTPDTDMKIKGYETIVIATPNCNIEELKHIIKIHLPFILKENDIGIKKLAYKVKENEEGYYLLYTWQGSSTDVTHIAKLLQELDYVLKYITVSVTE